MISNICKTMVKGSKYRLASLFALLLINVILTFYASSGYCGPAFYCGYYNFGGLTSACQGGVDTFMVSAPCRYPEFSFPGTSNDYYAVWIDGNVLCNGVNGCSKTPPKKIIASGWDTLKPPSVTLEPTGDVITASCDDGRVERFLVYHGNICGLKIANFQSTNQSLNPSSPGNVTFSSDIKDDKESNSGLLIGWEMNVAGLFFSGTGVAPFSPSVTLKWDGKSLNGKLLDAGTYKITHSAWIVSGKCNDYQQTSITVESSPCDLKIAAEKQTIKHYIGGNINITGDITDSSGNPITWTIELPNGYKKEGSGPKPSAIWDGKIDGKIQDGTYQAIISARSSDTCSKSENVPIIISPSSDNNSCSFEVQIGSSAHVASGNLSHTQDLFSNKGSALPLAMTLYYNSLDPNNGSLGRSWSHSYDISLTQNSDGSVLLKEGNWRRRLFSLSNGSYVSQPGDYSTLAKNPDDTFTLTRKDGTKYNFGTDGKITSILDRNGNADTFVYIGGNLTAITDPAGRTATLSYDADNHLSSVIDPSGNSYTFTYSNGALATITYPDGGTWRYTYDVKAFMLTKTDPLANTTTYTYDDSHRVISSTDLEGRTRNISYPTGTSAVKTTAFTGKDGGVWQYTYDTEKGTLNQKTDPQGGVTAYTYDGNGNRLSTTEPDGSITNYTFDTKGNMTSATDALGQTTSYTYNTFGQVTGIKDPQGNTTSYTYDANGNLATMTDPAAATTKYEYDAKGNVAKVTNSLGQATVFTYDTAGNLTSVTDSAGAKTGFTYDAAGNMISQTDANGATTRFEYNAKSQLVKVTDPKGNATTYAYDLSGNKVSETDANGNTTYYEYNAKGQVVKSKDALGNITSYTYGGTGCASCGGGTDKLTSITDANGNGTIYQYDNLGRLLNETDPLGNITCYSYDMKGNLTAKTDANGSTIQYSYDSLGRLLKKTYPDGTEESYTYDAKGNIITASNKNISYTFSYDASGRMLSATDTNGRTINYTYDGLGNRTKIVTPDGKSINYSFDSANRLTSIVNGGTFTFAYDALGRRTRLSYPNGATANYSYDNLGRLTSLVNKTGNGRIIDSFAYTLDNVGNRLAKTEPERKITYGYDQIYRLLQALPAQLRGWDNDRDDHFNHGVYSGENYTYDPVGNRLTGPQGKLSYLYNQGNQLIEQGLQKRDKHYDHNNGKTEYTYDKNGNLIKKVEPKEPFHIKTTTLYTYDFENRLVKVEIQRRHQEKVVTFTYDPFGRRLSKSVLKEEIEEDNDRDDKDCRHDKHLPRTTFYVYDNQNIIVEYDEKGKTTARYVHGLGIDEPLAIYKDGETYYYHADGLGTITTLTDKHGQIAQKYEYDSFGNLKNSDSRIEQPYTYTGREWDRETGLYYYRARYYDPMEGRFVSKDPIGFAGGDVNLFAYVKSNPVNFIDPMGLDAIPAPWGGAWGGAAEGVGTGASVSACGVFGGAAIIVAGSPTSTSTCADYPQPKECKDDKPCTPPEGTQCYTGPDTTHGHGGLGNHYHIYQMFKVAGSCQWQSRGGKVGKGVFETPPPGMLPCSSYPNFQGRGGR
jgi:RHS repeat-associated protein